VTSLDMSDTIAPKSDQLDAVDLLGGDRTFTIERVTRNNDEQPFNFHLSGFPRPWRPNLSMRRVLMACWGPDAATYVGRRVTLYCDPDVEFGGAAVGGTRIRALSHLSKPKAVPLLVKRGRSAMFTVKPLADEPTPAKVPDYVADAKAAQDIAEWRQVWQRAKDAGHLDNALKAKLTPIGEALKTEPVESPPVEDPPADGWPEVATVPGTDEA
jgi:hypothetical protein